MQRGCAPHDRKGSSHAAAQTSRFPARAFIDSLLALVQRRRDLSGDSILVTGGSRGLGLVVARELARKGAKVALLARDLGELERAREDLLGRGVPADRVMVLP